MLTPRMEGYEAALRLHGYPRELWPWLTEWARTLHRLFRKQDEVDWYSETGKTWGEITPDDVLPR